MNDHASHRHDDKKSSAPADHSNHHNHAGHSSMIGDYRKRFWISIVVTLPILIFSPMIQHVLGIRELWAPLKTSKRICENPFYPCLSASYSF